MLIRIRPDNIDDRRLYQVIRCLQKGGVIIYPTDTVYTLGCDISNHAAYERICALKDIKPAKAKFSFVFYDLSQLSEYTHNLANPVFKSMKKHLPGPYTYILQANPKLSRILDYPRKEIGIRVPNHPIPRAIIDALGKPIVSASIKNKDDILEYMTDAEEIYEQYRGKVDLVIDSGPCGNIPSTIIDYTHSSPVIVRDGAGEFML